MFENQNKKRKYGNKRNFLHKSPSKTYFRHRIHNFVKRADARGRSADIICRF